MTINHLTTLQYRLSMSLLIVIECVYKLQSIYTAHINNLQIKVHKLLMQTDLFSSAFTCLQCNDVELKLAQVAELRLAWEQGEVIRQPASSVIYPVPVPGRPAQPEMVSALDVDKRKLSTPEGRAALIHSLAHIEFNAINLALDAIYRFRDMPDDYYNDWLQVAAEEAGHFILLQNQLRTLGYDYGAFTAHNGLWDMAVVTAHDPMVRMALVPRVMEARGLDVLPGIMHKFKSTGNRAVVEILETILRDEIGHVAIGNRWYKFLCNQRSLEPIATFRTLLKDYNAPKLRGPLHTEARLAAGFSEEEIKMLEDSIHIG